MIGMGGTGLPERNLPFNFSNDGRPSEDLVQGELAIECWDARTMAEQHANGRDVLSVSTVFGPIPSDRGVERKASVLHQQVGRDCHKTFGQGEEQSGRGFGPKTSRPSIGVATPEINHLAPSDIDGDRGSDLARIAKIGNEGVRHRSKSLVGESM
jgi:hypothetical protein